MSQNPWAYELQCLVMYDKDMNYICIMMIRGFLKFGWPLFLEYLGPDYYDTS